MYSALLKHQLCNGFLQIIDCGNSRNVRTDLLPCSGQILGCRTSSGCLWGLLCWNLWTSSGCFSSLLVEVNNGTARHVVIRLVVTSSTTATKCAKPSVLSLSSHLRFCTFSHVLQHQQSQLVCDVQRCVYKVVVQCVRATRRLREFPQCAYWFIAKATANVASTWLASIIQVKGSWQVLHNCKLSG